MPLGTSSTKSVTGRALTILSVFDTAHTHLSLSDISRRAGLPTSTVYRIVSELAAWGALERGSDGRYSIGLRLWEVGSLNLTRMQLRDAAMLHLRHLHHLTKEDAYLAVLYDDSVTYIEIVGERRATAAGRVPPLRDTRDSAAGAALLACDPRYSRATGLLATVRRTGLALLPDTSVPAMHSLATPLFGHNGATIAAVGLFGDDSEIITRWQGQLLAATSGIRRRLLELAPDSLCLPLLQRSG
ncbi:helix-turn-helix domain-containing protein [Streptomyces sp. NPDC003077]|uniref:IclR family transcriptional regulator n=1 Tax=Streptomyces sp. NPDC003077 TaxID=3154443 RepID=UPI0033A39174